MSPEVRTMGPKHEASSRRAIRDTMVEMGTQ